MAVMAWAWVFAREFIRVITPSTLVFSYEIFGRTRGDAKLNIKIRFQGEDERAKKHVPSISVGFGTDLTYVWSQDVHKKGKRKVTSYPFRFPVHLIILLGTGLPKRCVPSRSAYYVSHDIAGPEVTLDPKRSGIVGRLLERLLVRFFHT